MDIENFSGPPSLDQVEEQEIRKSYQDPENMIPEKKNWSKLNASPSLSDKTILNIPVMLGPRIRWER